MKSKNIYPKIIFFMIGISSTVWFLFRVIPKPSRAAYPCMRAAAPFMSSFVIYLLGISVSWFSFKKFRQSILLSRYLTGSIFLFISFVAFGVIFLHDQKEAIANALAPADNTFPVLSNQPVGEAKGLHPGRVVWIHDKGATNENYVPQKGSSDFWYSNDHADESIISDMVELSIIKYSGAENISDAWDAIFRSFNMSKGKGDVGYTPGEKIAFKINLTNQSCSDSQRPQRMDATPQLLNAILNQMVNVVGVAQADITLGDPYREFREEYRDLVMSKYLGVYYVDGAGGNGVHQTVPSAGAVLVFSDGQYKSTLPQQYLDAAYVINIPCLKTHNEGGITLIAKNHQGSFLEKGDDPKSQYAINMHYSLPKNSRGSGQYRHTVDYMGHEETGGKGLIYIMDGIWAGESWEGWIKKFKSDPFNNDYPNSILVSQDPVALESVCYDILFNEYVADPTKSNYPIDMKVEIADHLSQCASSNHWPPGLQYDPEGDGIIMGSLGVFEHWNNPTDRQYSRNLGTGKGIELVTEKSQIIDYCDSSGIVITHVVSDVTCAESNDGSIEIEVTGNYPGFSYNWSNGASSGNIEMLTAGTYALTVMDAKDCSAVESITLVDPEKPAIGDVTGASNVEPLETLTYSVPDQDNFTWYWMADGGTLISGQGTHTVDIQWGSGTTGIVWAYAESGQGCSSDTSYLDVSIHSTGMGEFEAHGFSIYPVPARDFLVVETADLKPYSISLSSVNGAALIQGSYEGSSQVDLSMFPTGFYILTIQTGEFIASKKIILGRE